MTVFGPWRIVPDAAGVEPGRRLGDHLHLVGREAERVERRQRIGLGVVDADRRSLRPTSGGRRR